jgi:hypothetical protein
MTIMFNRAAAVMELKASLRAFAGKKDNLFVSYAQQKKLCKEIPDLAREEAEALIMIQRVLVSMHKNTENNSAEASRQTENVRLDILPNIALPTLRQQYISKRVDPLRSLLNVILKAEEKTHVISAKGDQAFAIQISLAKIFPFNMEIEPGKWVNPISLDEIDCDTPDLLVMSQAPAITKEDARSFYKSYQAFDENNIPKDYRGYKLNQREMQSLIEQNIFLDLIMKEKALLYPQAQSARIEIINKYTILGESLCEDLGRNLFWLNSFISIIVGSVMPFNYVLLIPLVIMWLNRNNRCDSILEEFLMGIAGWIFSISLVLPVAILIPLGLSYAAVITSATLMTIMNSTSLAVGIAASILIVIDKYKQHSAGLIILMLPKNIGRIIGNLVGVILSKFVSVVQPVWSKQPKYEWKDMCIYFRRYCDNSQPQRSIVDMLPPSPGSPPLSPENLAALRFLEPRFRIFAESRNTLPFFLARGAVYDSPLRSVLPSPRLRLRYSF